jgi:cadmium resistance protein CadD (predicted permease)
VPDILRAVGLFAVTNADDIVLPALFFARGVPAWRVVLGQYPGFAGIPAVAIAAALGATLALGVAAVTFANGGDNIGPSTSRSSPPPGSPDM